MRTIGPHLLAFLGLYPGGDLGPYTIYTTRRRHVVWFPRSPPKTEASWLQRRHRNSWSIAARVWSAMPKTDRDKWTSAAKLAHLTITGYNLFIHWLTVRDRSVIQTVERHSGISLL